MHTFESVFEDLFECQTKVVELGAAVFDAHGLVFGFVQQIVRKQQLLLRDTQLVNQQGNDVPLVALHFCRQSEAHELACSASPKSTQETGLGSPPPSCGSF